MKNLLYNLCFICGLCDISQAQLNGLYVKTGSVMVSESICFDNNRFSYYWKGDLGKVAVTCNGSYEVNKDTLILNSDLQLKDLIQIKQHSLNKLDSLYLSVITVSQELPFMTELIINDTTKIEITDKRGELLVLPNNFIEHLSIKSDFVDWRISRIQFKIDKSTTFIEIILDDTRGIGNAFFENEKFLIIKNRLAQVNKEDYYFIQSPNASCK